MSFDSTGKVSFDHIYTQPDPRAYFCTLRDLDYCIPHLAKPYFLKLIQSYRESRSASAPTIVDIGCSYGINAALLKCDLTMQDLYERYCGPQARRQTQSGLIASDWELVRRRNRLERARFVGLDTSQPALQYALAAGFLDDAVHADLERDRLSEPQRQRLADADILISTGCMGYITDRTITRIVEARGRERPWMAHFILRMFPVEPLVETLSKLGYEVLQAERVFKQRRFASPQEQEQILDALASHGVDPHGLETDGWLYAKLHIFRPRGCA